MCSSFLVTYDVIEKPIACFLKNEDVIKVNSIPKEVAKTELVWHSR